MGFAILTYLQFLVFVSNLIFPTHIMMLEGHLFHASIGGAMALGWLGVKGLERIRMKPITKKAGVVLVLAVILFLYGCKTWERNRDWKNDVTLFLKDVKNAPNSVLVLGNAGARWIDLADTKEITGIFLPGQDTSDINDYNGTLKITWDEVHEGGFPTRREAALSKGINYLKRAIELHPRYVNGYLNLGLAYFKLGDYKKCTYYWKVAERLYPDNPYLANYYIVYTNDLKNRGERAFAGGRFEEAIEAYKYYTIVKPKEAEGWYSLGGAYFNAGKRFAARYCWNKALSIDPDHERTRNAIKILDNGSGEVIK
jgi:tetratricopeptide (TPR) repeat protein